MGDYFDEEDLINDYIEDFDEPLEQDIPDEFLNADPNKQTESIHHNPDTPNPKDPDGDSTKENNLNRSNEVDVQTAISAGQKKALLEEEDLPPKDSKDDEGALHYFNQNRKKDVYMFQRYTGSREWRKASNTQFESKVRKRKHEVALEIYKVKNGMTKTKALPSTTASVAQLVHFSQHSPYHLSIQKSEEEQLYSMNLRYTLQQKQFSKSPIIGKESCSITLNNGDKIHMPRRYENYSINDTSLRTNIASDTLLGMPMSTLIKKTEMLKRRKFHLVDKLPTEDDYVADDDNGQNREDMKITPPQLWVDKHAPKIFSHLLSDERTNREVLRCLRQWDPYVFNRDPPARPEFIRLRMEEQQQRQQESEKANKEPPVNPNDKRPPLASRVLLLCGPPGVGKTTLAHIIAHHAGYNPLEINASDDRTANVLCERINQSMESNSSLITQNARPNCLILDEIDGANDKSTMNAIINIIKADLPPPKTKTGVGGSQTQPKRKKSTKTPYLRRPMIFIANHKFAPVLRSLLPYAKIFDVSPPSEYRLVSRLKSILSKENFTIHSSEQPLVSLVKGNGGDIRSCLHTLQFAASGARHDNIKKSDIRSDTVIDISQALLSAMGCDKNTSHRDGKGAWKDERTDMVETLMTVFRKAKQKEIVSTYTQRVDGDDGVDKVLETMESFNDSSKMIDNIFTNIASIPFIDPAFDRSSTAHEWLSAADLLRSFESSIAQNNLSEYLRIQRLHIPPAAAAIHLLCRIESNLRNHLVYSSRKMTDARFKQVDNSNLLNQFIHNLPPLIQKSVGGDTAVITDLLPYAMWLLSAGKGTFSLQRAVSSLEILNDKEKIVFWDHVKRLRALGLTYVKAEEAKQNSFLRKNGHNRENHGPKLRLEPEIDQLVTFKLTHPRDKSTREIQRIEIPSVLKELLAHGADIEAMRERENQSKKDNPDGAKERNGPSLQKNSEKSKRSKNFSSKNIGEVSNFVKEKTDLKRKSEAKEDTKVKKMKSNFLGLGAMRARAAKKARNDAIVGFDRSKKVKMTYSGSNIPLSQVIRFKYQKGFTQAVRMPCNIEDFL